LKFTIAATEAHERGKIYKIRADGKTVSILFTFHSLGRMRRWRLTGQRVLQALLFPEEVLRGHRDRFIAHRRVGRHVVRVVYEYEGKTSVVVTVYYPFSERYFKGEGVYEDRILA